MYKKSTRKGTVGKLKASHKISKPPRTWRTQILQKLVICCLPVPKNSCQREISDLGSNQSPKGNPKLNIASEALGLPPNLCKKILWFLSSQMTQITARTKHPDKTLAFFPPPNSYLRWVLDRRFMVQSLANLPNLLTDLVT